MTMYLEHFGLREALQIAQHTRLKSHSITEPSAQGLLRNMPGEFSECLLQHRSANNQFPNQVQHVIDAFGIYAQDEWKVRPNVTINYGVRWEYYRPLQEDRNLSVLFVAETGQLACNTHPGCDLRQGRRQDDLAQ